jgi:hypothetical protein
MLTPLFVFGLDSDPQDFPALDIVNVFPDANGTAGYGVFASCGKIPQSVLRKILPGSLYHYGINTGSIRVKSVLIPY